jgi:hypothetical protein
VKEKKSKYKSTPWAMGMAYNKHLIEQEHCGAGKENVGET